MEVKTFTRLSVFLKRVLPRMGGTGSPEEVALLKKRLTRQWNGMEKSNKDSLASTGAVRVTNWMVSNEGLCMDWMRENFAFKLELKGLAIGDVFARPQTTIYSAHQWFKEFADNTPISYSALRNWVTQYEEEHPGCALMLGACYNDGVLYLMNGYWRPFFEHLSAGGTLAGWVEGKNPDPADFERV